MYDPESCTLTKQARCLNLEPIQIQTYQAQALLFNPLIFVALEYGKRQNPGPPRADR